MANKVALVTGASRGIGKAISLRLAEAGMDIALVYAGNTAAAEECQKQIESLGVRARAYPCDVSDFFRCGGARLLCRNGTWPYLDARQ